MLVTWPGWGISNWLAQFSLPYVHADFHAAAYGADGTFYVGSDGGIFKSTNGGTSWANINRGITSHLIYSVGSSPAATGKVIARVPGGQLSDATVDAQQLLGGGQPIR